MRRSLDCALRAPLEMTINKDGASIEMTVSNDRVSLVIQQLLSGASRNEIAFGVIMAGIVYSVAFSWLKKSKNI
jgi:hypothetical protein